LPEPHSWNEEDATKVTFFGEEAWQNVQSRLSELIGANVHFIPPLDTFKCFSTNKYPSCSDLATHPNLPETFCCLNETFEFSALQQAKIIACVHHLQYAVIRIQIREEFIGTVLIGPFLLGKRESPEAYHKICEELGLEQEQFLDRLRELRVFSFSGIHSVLTCVEEVFKYAIQMNSDSHIAK